MIRRVVARVCLEIAYWLELREWHWLARVVFKLGDWANEGGEG